MHRKSIKRRIVKNGLVKLKSLKSKNEIIVTAIIIPCRALFRKNATKL